jgi:hypothetical protein
MELNILVELELLALILMVALAAVQEWLPMVLMLQEQQVALED